MSNTTRWGLPYPELTNLPDVPLWMKNLALSLDDVAKDDQGPLANRPVSTPGSPGKKGRYYTATDITPHLTFRDHGTGWDTIGAVLDGSVTTPKIADGAVTEPKLATGAVNHRAILDGTIEDSDLLADTLTARVIAPSLKPSGGAGGSVEALRALGWGPGLALGQTQVANLTVTGPISARPAPATVPIGVNFFATDTLGTFRNDGSNWILIDQRFARVTNAMLNAPPFNAPYHQQLIELVDSVSNPSYSHPLQYNANRGDVYKWEGLGGLGLTLDMFDASMAPLNQSSTGVINTGVIYTIPRTGIWQIELVVAWGAVSVSGGGDTAITITPLLQGVDMGLYVYRLFRKQTSFDGSTMNDDGMEHFVKNTLASAGDEVRIQLNSCPFPRQGGIVPRMARLKAIRIS